MGFGMSLSSCENCINVADIRQPKRIVPDPWPRERAYLAGSLLSEGRVWIFEREDPCDVNTVCKTAHRQGLFEGIKVKRTTVGIRFSQDGC